MKPAITVAFNTWRLGSIDPVVTSLEAQEDAPPFELLIIDELYRWRASALQDRLAACPFPVKHLPVERSLFPVASTMRAGNTAIRNAEGVLFVNACDGAILPPHFLAAHWDSYLRAPKSIGVAPYRGHRIKAAEWTLPTMDAWDMVETCVKGGPMFPTVAWTGLRGRAPLTVAMFQPLLGQKQRPPDFRQYCDPDVFGGSPALAETGIQPGQEVNEWFAHYKTDGVALEGLKAVNGWDEEYDGGYIYADIDMTLRLQAAGYRLRVIGSPSDPIEVPVLDLHPVTRRGTDIAFRQWWMTERLVNTRRALQADPQAFRCVEGLSRPDRTHALIEAPLGMPNPTVRVTIVRKWLEALRDGGRVDLNVPVPYALAWEYVAPTVLVLNDDGKDWGCFRTVLGDKAVVLPWAQMSDGENLFESVVAIGGDRFDAYRAIRAARSTVIVIGEKNVLDAVEREVADAGYEEVMFFDADDSMPVNAIIVRKRA